MSVVYGNKYGKDIFENTVNFYIWVHLYWMNGRIFHGLPSGTGFFKKINTNWVHLQVHLLWPRFILVKVFSGQICTKFPAILQWAPASTRGLGVRGRGL